MTVLLHLFIGLSCVLDLTLGLFLIWLVIRPDHGRPPKRYYWRATALYSAVYIALSFAPVHSLLKYGVTFVFVVLYGLKISDGKTGVSLFLATLQLASIYACEGAVPFIFSALFPHLSMSAVTNSSFPAVFSVLTSRSLLYLLWGAGILLFHRRRQTFSPSYIHAPQWIILCAAVGLLASFVVAFQWVASSQPENIMSILGAFPVIFLIVIILFFLLAISLSHEAERKYRLQSELLRAEQQLAQQKAIGSMYEQLRGMQHDFRNHMQIIGALAEQQHDAEVSAYIRDIAGQLVVGNSLIRTGILAVDSLLNSKFIHAEKHGISIDAEVYFPEPLAISVSDLCTVLFNLVDNAIEACEKNQSDASRHLRLDLYQRDRFLVICCRNPCETKPVSHKHGFQTTKTGDLHGIGMRQLQRIAEKYDGFFHAAYEDGVFTAKLAFSHDVDIRQIHTSCVRPQMLEQRALPLR